MSILEYCSDSVSLGLVDNGVVVLVTSKESVGFKSFALDDSVEVKELIPVAKTDSVMLMESSKLESLDIDSRMSRDSVELES